MNPDDALLLNAFKGYREALLAPCAPKSVTEDLPFSDRLWRLIQQRFTATSFDLLKQVWDTSIQGLGLAREGAHDAAEQCFHRARVLTCPETLGREGLLISRSVIHGAEAYLMHRYGLFEEAHRMVGVALDADEELERVYGYALLIGHRVQLVHNTIRVLLRERHHERAFVLLGSVLAFIEGYGERLPLHHSWVSARLNGDSGWDLMERQLVVELALAMTSVSARHWATFCQHLQMDRFLDGPSLDRLSRDWIALKHAYVCGETMSFLMSMPSVLSQAFSQSALLFYSVLWDFFQILNEADTSLARALQQQLMRDSQKWVLPKGLAPLWMAVRATHMSECASAVN